MHKPTAQSLVALIVIANLTFLMAAAPSIGIAVAKGDINIDKVRTPGNSPLFEGNILETNKTPARLQLTGGARIVLASDSKGMIYRDRLILEKGSTQVDAPSRYDVSAGFLRIAGTEPGSSARVAMKGPTVQVASLSGTLQVSNAQGLLLTRIAPGLAFDFTPQDRPAGATMPQHPPEEKKKKNSASAAPGGGNGGMTASQHTAIIAGILIVAAVGTTVGILATNGEAQPGQGVSPARP